MRTKKLCATLILAFFILNSFADYLSISNPRTWGYWSNGSISNVSISIEPHGIYSTVNLYMTITDNSSNYYQGIVFNSSKDTNATLPVQDSLEVSMYFALPQGSIMTDAWLWMGEDPVKALLLDRTQAREIYEEIVRRRKDPLIVYKNGSNYYQLNIFPILSKGSRKLKLSYLVPNTINASTIQVPLPLSMLSTSAADIENYSVYFKVSDKFSLPVVNGMQGSFTTTPDDKGFVSIAIPAKDSKKVSAVSFSTPIENAEGVIASTYSSAKENYFELTFKPEDVFNIKKNKKMLFVIDNDTASKRYYYYYYRDRVVTNEYIYNSLESYMIKNLSSTDKFNVIVKTNGIYKASNVWLTATSTNINNVISALKSNNYTYTDNIEDVLIDAQKFLNQNDGGELYLVSNNFYQEATQDSISTKLIENITNAVTQLYPINIIDLGNSYYYDYYGSWEDENFYPGWYTNPILSKIASGTKGLYTSIYQVQSLSPAIAYFNKQNTGKIRFFETNITAENGAITGKITLNNSKFSVFPNERVLIYGKYTGSPLFTVSVTGELNGTIVKKSITVQNTSIIPSDSTLQTAWWGAFIAQLEADGNESNVKEEVVKYSLEQRILSNYTSFLALEPNDTISLCEDCVPEWSENASYTTSSGGKLSTTDGIMVSNSVQWESSTATLSSTIVRVTDSTNYNDGYDKGLTDCNQKFSDAYETGYKSGYTFGYGDGYNKQASESSVEEIIPVTPNPFVNSVTLDLQKIEIKEIVSIKIYDALGKEVKTFNKNQINGTSLQWVADSSVKAGIYSIIITMEDESEIMRQVVKTE